jgi:hypothetical protein
MTTIRLYSDSDRDVLRRLVLALHETLRPFDADLAPGREIIDRYFEGLKSGGQYTYCAFRLIYHDYGHLSNGYTVPGTPAQPWLKCEVGNLVIGNWNTLPGHPTLF